jgi:hypothetical protein
VSGTGSGSGRNKKSVSSCEGGTVDVDVDLRVSCLGNSSLLYRLTSLRRALGHGHWKCKLWGPRARKLSPSLELRLLERRCESRSRRTLTRMVALLRLTFVSLILQLWRPRLKTRLVSVEDRYKCKKTLSVQSVSVNVRRVKVCSLVRVLDTSAYVRSSLPRDSMATRTNVRSLSLNVNVSAFR